MRLGLSTYTYTWAVGVPGASPEKPMTVYDLLERAQHLGVPVVQIADNLPLDRMAPGDIDDLAARARSLSIDIEVGTRGIEPEHLRRHVDLARRLGSPLLRVVVDTANRHPSPAEVVAELRVQRTIFEDASIVLGIENHDRFSAAVLAGIVQDLGADWAGVCLDTVNSFGALEGPDVVIDTLAPLAVNLHVKDFAIERPSHKMGFVVEGRPAGRGRLDIPRLFDALGGKGRDITAVLELWTPPARSVAATVEKERQWAQESVAYLQKQLLEP